MKICVFYTSPKLEDIVLQLPFIKAISKNYNTKVFLSINSHIQIKNIKLGICWEHGGYPNHILFCSKAGLIYVSFSPYRVPVARLAVAQAEIKKLSKL